MLDVRCSLALFVYFVFKNRGLYAVEAAILPLCLRLESDKSVASTLPTFNLITSFARCLTFVE